ncbi:NAD-dependent epimerase/dehydratase family protein [Streptomyces alanosinicus]|uniref:NAD-dependent dehydratase n=1 Tax=Streptomyces alanosinicus TaxID=68171 RepID=A0A919D0Q9_9ACTN|nr:SDR family oxidoreductase [Streptomyces alanosinicus]GHE01645.1 NAD-dependent dehydratase [Streptomyces alanosinicus]
MRVLLTGHQGYIGTVLADMLRSAGHDVRGLDIGLFADAWCGPEKADPEGIRADVRDSDIAHCADTDAVIHLAALSNDPSGALRPRLTEEINFRATLRLATAAKAAGVERFLFSSSCSIYGSGSDAPRTEDDEVAPLTEYAQSKIQSEEALGELASPTFAPTYLRNATAYGFSPRLRTDLVVNDLTATAFATGRILLKSDGTAWRPLIHVEDIAHAFTVLLDAPTELITHRAYNVGIDEENYLVRDVAQIVQEEIPGSRLEFESGASADRRSYRVDFGRLAREVPAFRPRWTVRKGVQHLAEMFTAHGIPSDRLLGPDYRRLNTLQASVAAGEVTPDFRVRHTEDAR